MSPSGSLIESTTEPKEEDSANNVSESLPAPEIQTFPGQESESPSTPPGKESSLSSSTYEKEEHTASEKEQGSSLHAASQVVETAAAAALSTVEPKDSSSSSTMRPPPNTTTMSHMNPTSVVHENDPYDVEYYRAKITVPNRCIGVFGFGSRKEQPEMVHNRLKAYGPTESADFIMDPISGKHRGYGFITFRNVEDASRLIADTTGKGLLVGGLRIRLDFAKSATRNARKGPPPQQAASASRPSSRRNGNRRMESPPPPRNRDRRPPRSPRRRDSPPRRRSRLPPSRRGSSPPPPQQQQQYQTGSYPVPPPGYYASTAAAPYGYPYSAPPPPGGSAPLYGYEPAPPYYSSQPQPPFYDQQLGSGYDSRVDAVPGYLATQQPPPYGLPYDARQQQQQHMGFEMNTWAARSPPSEGFVPSRSVLPPPQQPQQQQQQQQHQAPPPFYYHQQ